MQRPQQNDVVERKNRTVQEAARTMLNEAKLSNAYWREALYTAVYILNRGELRVKRTRLLTNYGMEYHPQSNISKYLAVIVTLKGTRTILESFPLGLMKEYF